MKYLLIFMFTLTTSLFLVSNSVVAEDLKYTYFRSMDDEEVKRMEYIMNFLTTKSTFAVLKNKQHLNEEGDKFTNLHPLLYWKEVLTGKYGKKLPEINFLVKKDMIKRLTDDLARVDKAGEMKEEYYEDFSKSTGIPLEEIHKYSEKKDWKGLSTLILNQK